MVSGALEISINLSGTMVLFIYMSTLLFAMWGIEKFMKPHTFIVDCSSVAPNEYETSDSSASEEEGEEEEGETQEEAGEPVVIPEHGEVPVTTL